MQKEKQKNALSRAPYDNYKIYHPDGTLMCFCSKKKASWYLKNNLATLNNDNHIILKFKPKGYGDPIEILVGRSNCCVISGKSDDLTKHHVIPTQYRQYFELSYKDKNSCDIVVLCRKEHDKYEEIANDFKLRLFNDFVDESMKEKNHALNEARLLLNGFKKYYNNAPPERQIYMICRLEGLKEKYNFSDEELLNPLNYEHKNYNKIIVNSIGEINLIILWKLHFMRYGKPKYLPDWWKPNLIKKVNKNTSEYKTELISINLENDSTLLKLLKKYDLYETSKLYI